MVKNETKSCVVCGDPIPKERRRKDTCSDMCGFQKMAAWDAYLKEHKDDLMKAALTEFLL